MNANGEFADVGPKGLTMRVGLSAGDVMVGDFGAPPTNSSYTTLGDTTNLAARLEGANKVFGSRILVSERLKTLAEVHVAEMRSSNAPAKLIPPLLWRPLGRVRVKGKLEPVGVFELVGDLVPFGPRTADWIATTERLIRSYQAGDFDACDSVIAQYAADFGDSALLDLYRDAMIEWAARVDRAEAFDGCVELKEK
ncbi:MAG: adenylate/guanylate cyclase domain-containing protein, partial [Phycisphaerales bacterium]|nr:adenylate/guanylate cyclase domain-containing protein [Phycisphaerales bacterium]